MLQNIKCQANTDMLTLDWMEVRPNPWVDFSINHQCRDWDAFLQWSYDAALDEEKFDNMPKPKDAYIWPAPWIRYETELGRKLHSGIKEGIHPVLDEYHKMGHVEHGHHSGGYSQNEHQH